MNPRRRRRPADRPPTERSSIPKLYFEDFIVGETVEMGRRTVERDEIVAFATQFDPQPFHVDDAAAATGPFGGLIASGWHTVSLVMRMMCDNYLLDAASLGSPGVEHVKWLKPVRPGDTIRATRTILEARASKSKPEVGIVKSRWDVYNQHDEPVMTMEGYGMFGVRHPDRSIAAR